MDKPINNHVDNDLSSLVVPHRETDDGVDELQPVATHKTSAELTGKSRKNTVELEKPNKAESVDAQVDKTVNNSADAKVMKSSRRLNGRNQRSAMKWLPRMRLGTDEEQAGSAPELSDSREQAEDQKKSMRDSSISMQADPLFNNPRLPKQFANIKRNRHIAREKLSSKFPELKSSLAV